MGRRAKDNAFNRLSFHEKLRTRGYQSYADYLASDHWRQVRRRWYASGFNEGCYVCARDCPVQLHHKTYRRLGRERLTDLIALCDECHEGVHGHLRSRKATGTFNLWTVAKRYRDSLIRKGKAPTMKERKRLQQQARRK